MSAVTKHLLVVALALAASMPVGAQAQQPTKLKRIGMLMLHTSDCEGDGFFLKGLIDIGWKKGETFNVACRHAAGRTDGMSEAAVDLVRQKPDVIVALTNIAAFAAKRATSEIPIVVWGMHGAVETGLVDSLGRPGGNVTGVESLAPEVDAKRVELLKEMLPRLATIGVLYNPDDPGSPVHLKYTRIGTRAFGVEISTLEGRRAADFDAALQTAVAHLPDALLIFTDPQTFDYWPKAANFALSHRLPTMCEFRVMAEAGCLIAYGATGAEFQQIIGRQIDRILRGAKVADLPAEQVTRYELSVNLKSARALGVTLPPSVLARADHLIQ